MVCAAGKNNELLKAAPEAIALIVPSLAGSLAAALDPRKLLAARIEGLLDTHPISKVLTSMPEAGVWSGARIAS
ncbi:hypothetical protein ABZ532_31010 [Streptomyces sp. NPDC019396]|uniref:hypothetical protein n=1 Tax=Streptomyces sp. NPDC019396 TaxID=3154687 RepID=UPI0033E19715